MSKLKAYRAAKGLTLAAMGAKVGVAAETIRRYEDEGRVPEREIAIDIYVITNGKVKPQHFYSLPDLKG